MLTYDEIVQMKMAFTVIDWGREDISCFKGPRHWIKYSDGCFQVNGKVYEVEEMYALYHSILGQMGYPDYDINLYGCWIEAMYKMWRRDNGK